MSDRPFLLHGLGQGIDVMKWSWTVGSIFGIKLRIHWTFLLLLIWVGTIYGRAEGGLPAAARGIGFILAVFGCVVLHECGHALMARRFGVPTEDITLLPIGGVARMQRIPDVPMQEFWIAIAGPAVNVVIAGLLFVGLLATSGLRVATAEPSLTTSFFTNLMWVNVLLVAFNVLPAFPMDGGRVLRSLLALQMDYTRATGIAVSVGQGMAILFGVVGLFTNPFLLFIALFVYIGAEAELQMVQLRDLVAGVRVRDAIMTDFNVLAADATLDEAADMVLAGTQQDFPVMDGGDFRGILYRQKLLEGLRDDGGQARVGDWASDVDQRPTLEAPLWETLEKMREKQSGTLPVFANGELVGLLSSENISELLMIRSARSGQDHGPASPRMMDAG
jgi:Zn-dependent protease